MVRERPDHVGYLTADTFHPGLQACDMCRKKKIKCDGKLPACTHCINYKTDCVFTQVEKKRNPPKGCVGTPRRTNVAVKPAG